MEKMMRLPALPLIVNDPYFSLWCAGDQLTDCDVTHWAGSVKRVRGTACIDGACYRFLGFDGTYSETSVQVGSATNIDAYRVSEGHGDFHGERI